MLDPILIVGAPRSGTSVTAGTLYKCGAWVGRMVPADIYNPKGYFENNDLYSYLRTCCELTGPSFLNPAMQPDDIKLSIKNEFAIPSESPWILKHPGLVTSDTSRDHTNPVWPFLNGLFPTAKWIIVRRNEADILKSIEHFGTGSDESNYKMWAKVILDEIPKLKQSGVQFLEIWPFKDKSKDRMVGEYAELISWLGLEWNEATVREFIDLSLCHHCSSAVSMPVLDGLS